ncbi:MAG: polysaccharide export protein [Alphaproteobacteria bacterium]|nr:polysaccharide export protein [Alphaproteobacteria bacterium]
MKLLVLFAGLGAAMLAGCSWFPGSGPAASEVVEQAQARGEILFDVVDVNDRVVTTLLSRPGESFRARFQEDAGPPDVKIAVGDAVSVVIWESSAGGLFGPPPPTPVPGLEPTAPQSQPPSMERRGEAGGPAPPGTEAPPEKPSSAIRAAAGQNERRPATIPEQEVGADGGISVPYAGRIPVAGRSPAEVQHTIEARLAGKALEPQALVIVRKSPANAVTVAGELVPHATRVPLSVGGDRLLQVIAAAGGVRAPVHETFVRLTRGGVTATLPLARVVADPSEDIYARPGDVLTLVRVPQTFSVFGATGRNAEITFDAEKLTLSEALGKSQGLDDNLANPKGVFLFRYEPNSTVRALDQPVATTSKDGRSPIAYRFDLQDGNSYLLAKQFPVRDKDIIFVADAGAVRVERLFALLANITGPVTTGFLVCSSATC